MLHTPINALFILHTAGKTNMDRSTTNVCHKFDHPIAANYPKEAQHVEHSPVVGRMDGGDYNDILPWYHGATINRQPGSAAGKVSRSAVPVWGLFTSTSRWRRA